MAYTEDSNLIDTYFKYLGKWGNTKLASENTCISIATGRKLEQRYPDKAEEAMFEYREMLREELIKRIKDPEKFSERLLLKELEMIDHRYRPRVEVQHNHSVELVGRLQRAKERMIQGGEIKSEPVPPVYKAITAKVEQSADNRAPTIKEELEEDVPTPTVKEIIDADFSEL